MDRIRVRFAPSPTGPLHIGGVRTALYTYLFAKKHQGDFILRIEDTDQNRYVDGAEDYIRQSLEWCGINPDEGPVSGGEFGPYRQSERKDMYRAYAEQLVENGHAYYAFDTPEEIEAMRTRLSEEGNRAPKYDHSSRLSMKNSLTLSATEVESLKATSANTIIRLKVVPGQDIIVKDQVRGEVTFQSSELDDKVLLKADGMPTYHMANIVDDRTMEVSHVIRGEEWLPSTAHHVLLYRGLGWEDQMPYFAHLPLILKPNGKGKLSKRDGAKFGFPVFPLSWNGKSEEDSFIGFKEFGFDPRATVNFLAFLGWNPGTEQEIFSMDELAESFSIEQIVKSGARFDIDKAKWYNQQYILSSSDSDIAALLKSSFPDKFGHLEDAYLEKFANLMKPRVTLYPEFYEMGYYFFEPVKEYEEKMIRKKWNDERKAHISELVSRFSNTDYTAANLKSCLTDYLEENGIGFGDVLPFLRIGNTGTMKGPDIFEVMELLGQEEVVNRMSTATSHFDTVVANK